MNKTVFITGATSGIGKATAIAFAAANYDLIITGRREERLDELAALLNQQYNIRVVSAAFDVRNNASVTTAIQALIKEGMTVDILVNNAGLASGPFLH